MAMVLAVLLLGCREAPPADTPDEQRAATELSAAITGDDWFAFANWFADAADPQRRDQLWRNLRQLQYVRFEAGAQDAWRVAWSVPGEASPAHQVLEPRWDCSAGCRLLDLAPHAGSPAPIWLTGEVALHQRGAVSVLGGPAADKWLEPAIAATAAVSGAGLASLIQLPATLVVEVPGDTAAVEQVMAAPAADFEGTGALTWLADTGRSDGDRTEAAVRIVVNPDAVARLDDASRTLLLAHEAVHGATAALGAPARGRLWVSEGLAEYVALPLDAAEQRRSLATLAATCPVSAQPPADEQFRDPAQVGLAYAWAGLAVGQIAAGAADPAATIRGLWEGQGSVPQWQVPPGLC